jgi:undecaprenyl-phosphate galactose phosphotransferase
MKKLELYFGLIKIPLDLILIILAFISALHFRTTDLVLSFLAPVTRSSFYYERSNFIIEYAVPMSLLLFGVLLFNRAYSLNFKLTLGSELKKIFISIIFWMASVISYFFLIRDFPFSRFVLVVSAVFAFVYLFIFRVLIKKIEYWLMRKGIGVQKVVLLVSDKSQFTKVLEALKSDVRYKVVGYISKSKFNNLKLRYYGGFSDINLILAKRKFDTLIQVGENDQNLKNKDLIDLCRYYQKEYQFLPDVLHIKKHNIVLTEVSGLPIFRITPTPLDGWGRVYKRSFDIIASGLGLLVLSPFFLIVALLIKLDSKGPAMFRKDDSGNLIYRVGQKGSLFCCYKFRTMQVNTHTKRYNELLINNIRKNSPLVKIKNDPRVTKLGKFLRRFDIDELPQLLNVFKGDMSLIGPRPHLFEEVAKYKDNHKFVLTIKPGITGLAQVSGRSDLEFDDEVRLDSYYIENWSFLLDIKILLKTVAVVFAGHSEMN